MTKKKAIIVGAGLAGSLWAIYLAKAGYKVKIYERRPDIREAEISAGKSINLALSTRGWKALEGAGIKTEVEKIAIPMPGRMMHDLEGNLTFQPYGKEGEAIYSVSRGHLNAIMMDLAEKSGDVEIFYNHKCIGANLKEGEENIKEYGTNNTFTDKANVVFGADGAFSAIRYKGFQKTNRFDYSQDFIDDGYKELLLPANEDGSYKLEKNALHIWPRGRFMLIALPNEDGSFTCTLFMPFEGENSFESIKNDDDIVNFFKSTFPDFYELIPNLVENWHKHPLSSLSIIRCYPWTKGKTALLGDAAHATVPFYGQGMNASFEDCTVLYELMLKHNENWKAVFKEYQETRKKDGDAIQDLSLHNYYVMRDFVADPKFLLQKKIEAQLMKNHPDKWMPLYSQVTFSHIPYSKAWELGKKQDAIMKQVMDKPNISDIWNSTEIETEILNLIG
jgi:kynurenine 3-monooxygenase